MQISFKQKLPLYTHLIFNNQTKQFENATFYEITCDDSKDVDYFSKNRQWKYMDILHDDVCSTYNSFLKNNSKKVVNKPFDIKFYSIETDENDIAAICETNEFGKNKNIELLESNNKNYKYAAQTMIACLAKEIIKNSGNKLMVRFPMPMAMDFYKLGCNFKKDDAGISLNKDGMEDLIGTVEKRVKSRILDFEV